jgi:hypothetical protein
MNDLEQRLNGDLGEEAQVEALRELLRVSIQMAFGAFRWLGTGGVTVTGNVVSYNGGGGR